MLAEVATIGSSMRWLMAFDVLGGEGTPEEWLPSRYGPSKPEADTPESDVVEVSADDRARQAAAEILA